MELPLNEHERVFVARMLENGFNGSSVPADYLVSAARSFARHGADHIGDWIWREFRGREDGFGKGTYFERGRDWRWFDGLSFLQAHDVLNEEAANSYG